ncbi:glutathione transferase [Ranunculus cassubicifolius]
MAAVPDVKILGSWASPFVMRPCIALNLKNVKYDFRQEQFGVKSDLLLKSNPVHKKIPVMIHNDKPICESLIIVQYIDDFFNSSGPAILPVEPYDRAIARFWAAYVDDKWFGLLRGVTTAKTDEEKKAAIEAVTAGVGLLEDAFQEISKGKSYFGGDTVGYVDIAFGSCLGWMKVSEKLNGFTLLGESSTPGLYGWAERFCADEAVKDVMPETEKLAEFAKALFARMAGAGAQARK